MAKQDMDQATTFGLMSLRLAESLGKTEAKNDSLDLLASAYTRLDQPEQAQGYFEQISQSYLSKYADSHLQAAEKAFEAKQSKLVAFEATIAVQEISLLEGKPSELLQRAATTCEKCQRPSEASQMRERLGEFAKAAELAEAAGEADRALALLKQLVAQDPKEKGRVSEFRLRSGTRTLEDAEAALTDQNLEVAEQSALSALSQLEGAANANDQKARCLTVLAKVAFQQERIPEAAAFATSAKAASPNPDRLARAKAYRLRDAELVTRDELDVETFVFPPAKKSNKFYTYAYYLGSQGNYVSAGKEELFAAPKDEIKAGLRYSRPEQGVGVRLTSYDGRSYYFDFDAGGDKILKPGLYEEATGSNYNNPGLTFGGDGRGGNTNKGKFIVHEIVWDGDTKIQRFAADFIADGGYSHDGALNAVYGKVRYNSTFE
jgi:hypothetical protein